MKFVFFVITILVLSFCAYSKTAEECKDETGVLGTDVYVNYYIE